jgi:PAP2 superfamily
VAAGAAVGAVVTSVLAKRDGRRTRQLTLASAALRETAVVMCLYSLWQYSGSFSVMGVEHAVDRGKWIVKFQSAVWLPSEKSIQSVMLPFPWLVRFANLYYAIVHVPALVATLFWGFFGHRKHYGRLRNALVLSTAGCLAVQLIPVAPPRMLVDLGFVDTGALYNQSVYDALGRGMAGQLSAMPSVHVGWAVIVGWFSVVAPCRWWLRTLAISHAVLTVLVVVGTGNHFWLDGIVAALFLVLSLIVISAATKVSSRATAALGARRLVTRPGSRSDVVLPMDRL